MPTSPKNTDTFPEDSLFPDLPFETSHYHGDDIPFDFDEPPPHPGPDGKASSTNHNLLAIELPKPPPDWNDIGNHPNSPAGQEAISQDIRLKRNMLDTDGRWATCSLGGPVEPYYPEPLTSWNGILIVGKSPGDAEIFHNLPFSGRSGRLLTSILDVAGIDRSRCIITNTIRMQPLWTVDGDGRKQANDLGSFFTMDPTIADVTLPIFSEHQVTEVAGTHVHDLRRLITTAKPAIVIALGSLAAWAVTDEGGIKGRNGYPLTAFDGETTTFISNHPAHALHKKDESIAVNILNDIKAALAYMQIEKSDWTPTDDWSPDDFFF